MSNKVVIVTGASRGIGAATSYLLAKNKFNVSLVYKSSDKEAKKIFEECKKLSDCILIKADVTNDKDCKKIVKETEKILGPINILINNAGRTKFVDFKDFDGLNEKDFIEIYKTNVVSIFQMVRACRKSLLKTNKPKIINISSIAALGLGSSIAYACSKGAVNSLSLSLARTLAPSISVNTICPGYVETNWHGKRNEIKIKSIANAKLVPLKKSALPEDIASTIMWFVNSAHLITGETVYVDGGLHLKV